MDIYCLDQLTVYWNARRILNIDFDKKKRSGEQKEKRNLKRTMKNSRVEEFKVLYNKAEHNRDYYLYDPICSK